VRGAAAEDDSFNWGFARSAGFSCLIVNAMLFLRGAIDAGSGDVVAVGAAAMGRQRLPKENHRERCNRSFIVLSMPPRRKVTLISLPSPDLWSSWISGIENVAADPADTA
jgi:hypothetical protein